MMRDLQASAQAGQSGTIMAAYEERAAGRKRGGRLVSRIHLGVLQTLPEIR